MLVVVTGASTGFGYHISKLLVEHGHKVIGVARREDKLAELKNELKNQFYPLVIDMTELDSIATKLESLPEDFKIDKIDALVNNAGLALGLASADKASLDDWYRMIDTNIKGLVTITHVLLPYFVKNNKGTIINMGSVAGNYPYPGANVYGGTKAFVEQFSLNLRADLAGYNIRVTNIEPGLCGGTEFSLVRFHGDQNKADNVYDGVKSLSPEDIANTVDWILALPEHVNVNRIELMPVMQSFNGFNVVKK
ncbi:SDR family NAD(P)-dependent oxidoreductase [Acinetobacter gerneri]|uniref:SDR family NAD(P)-dependent oxidoreductase n=1 Tax=Acinetobacter gerneri TaxID=202952 RepID=UPI003212040E